MDNDNITNHSLFTNENENANEKMSGQFGGENDAQKNPEGRSIDFLLDIPLEVSVELGRCKMLIHELLQLGQGSVIELTKLAGEPLDVLINNKLIARGEAVVINEKFGVRLTDIVSPLERIERLGD